MLVAGFKEFWPKAWPSEEAALKEVHTALDSGRINRLALADEGDLLGWVGAIPQYNGHTWELHPLVVRPDHQGRGVGRALVLDLEAQVRQAGGLTIYLGTDDEANMTTLSNIDLYLNVFEHIRAIKNLRRHPYEFYQKLGYTIVGVIPDANGPGKPDLLMAKRLLKLKIDPKGFQNL